MRNKSNNTIKEHIKIIQEAINNKRNLAIFVGAGVSKNSDVPTWKEIINKFASDLHIDESDIFPSNYLKIAQCYYDTHPQKYKKILNENLNKDWKTNLITSFLFDEYSPKYFITTNYDCILEKTAEERKNKNYKLICKDEDIPEIKDHAIIKMHGDFKNKNIVFKESDYAEYSLNFKLTETFIKSIFATSVVLFIGFSADDPNVIQIHQWVKDILKNNKQPSYLISCDKIENYKKYEVMKKYLKRKDIYTLNYYEIENSIDYFYKIYPMNNSTESEIEKLPHEIGKNLYKMLYFIKYYKVDLSLTIENRINLINLFNYLDENFIFEYLFEDNSARYNSYEKRIILCGKKIKGLIIDLYKSKNDVKYEKIKNFLISKNIEFIEYRMGNSTLEVQVANI